jgi:hypothetical protein
MIIGAHKDALAAKAERVRKARRVKGRADEGVFI